MRLAVYTIKFLFILSLNSLAIASGSIDFSQEEISINKINARGISEKAAACLDRIYQDHIDFFNENQISKYYGVRRKDYSTKELRIEALVKKFGLEISKAKEIANQQKDISCVDLTRKCLKEGFDAFGLANAWSRIDSYVVKNGVSGIHLQSALKKLGWKIYYWNPDPTQNAIWDEEDLKINPPKFVDGKAQWNSVWGGHAARYATATRNVNPSYYNVPVDNSTKLVGFGKGIPVDFKEVPFFVGTTHAGYHVFPGRNGDIIEAHSKRDLNSIDNLQYSIFSPLQKNGGPRWTKSEKYRSGIIAVPEEF